MKLTEDMIEEFKKEPSLSAEDIQRIGSKDGDELKRQQEAKEKLRRVEQERESQRQEVRRKADEDMLQQILLAEHQRQATLQAPLEQIAQNVNAEQEEAARQQVDYRVSFSGLEDFYGEMDKKENDTYRRTDAAKQLDEIDRIRTYKGDVMY